MSVTNHPPIKERLVVCLTDSYIQCYDKVEEFLTYLTEETEDRGLPGQQLEQLRKIREELTRFRSVPQPPYLIQLMMREGHAKAVELIGRLNRIATAYEDLKTQTNTAVRDSRVVLQSEDEVLKQPIHTYVFSSVDDIPMNDTQVQASDLNPKNLVAVDLSQIHGGGGFGTVYIGQGEGYGKVAVKRLNRQVTSSKILSLLNIEKFRREAAVWAQLKHENILPLLGVCVLESTLHMVSPFMANGNVREYVTLNPGANRVAFLREIASGLKYMHDINIIHGDVKGPNILISDTEHALLCDFGLTRLISEDTTIGRKGSKAWMSPEQWNDGKTSFATDVHALGITISE
ncbi:hypothetical protein FRB99_003181, partial [Tulasnella sp. 403]